MVKVKTLDGKDDREYSNYIVSDLIDEWVHSERNRKILKRKLIDGLTFEQLAEEFKLSVRQVKTIVYRNSERVFIHMK